MYQGNFDALNEGNRNDNFQFIYMPQKMKNHLCTRFKWEEFFIVYGFYRTNAYSKSDRTREQYWIYIFFSDVENLNSIDMRITNWME